MDFLPIDAPRFVHVELQDSEIFPETLLKAAERKDYVRIITDSARWTKEALEAKGLTFSYVQITERAKFTKSQKRAVVHAAMSKKEIIASYIAARPVPTGVTVEQAARAMAQLWGEA